MKSSYFFYKTSAFLVILLTGTVYLASLGVLLVNLSSAIINSIKYLYALCTPTPHFSTLFSSSEFPLVIAFSIAWAALISHLVLNTFRIGKKYRATRRFIASLEIKESRGKLKIIKSKEYLALTAGLLKPQVFISDSLIRDLNNVQLNVILEHESTHAREYDPFRNLLVEFILRILPPWPQKQNFLSSYITLGELYCDERATNSFRYEKTLIETMLLLTKNNSREQLKLALMPHFSLNNSRINILVGKNLFDFKHFFTFLFIVTIVVLSQLLFLARTSAFVSPEYINECFASIQHDSEPSKPMSGIDQKQSTPQ